MSRVPVNPFALGAAFVERAVEMGWVEVYSDGRRNSYFLTDSGNEGLEKFGVQIEKALQFAILPERSDSAPRRRASSSMQAHRQAHGLQQGGSHPSPARGQGMRVHHERHQSGERHERRESGERREQRIHHERQSGQRKRT